MKRLLAKSILSICIITSLNVYIFAGPLSSATDMALPVERFEITGGIDGTKEIETTFDKTKTISGTAEEGTEIIISVYEPNEKNQNDENDDEEFTELNSYTLIVGPSGIFSQTIDLEVGENYIVISANKDDKNSSFETIIKRKKSEIKTELEKGIVLPGQPPLNSNVPVI